jgi:hypothetical protein
MNTRASVSKIGNNQRNPSPVRLRLRRELSRTLTPKPTGTSLPINRDVPLEREDTRSPGICVFEEDISTLEFNKKILE